MKKVGVLTFHRAINNGAVLQAYALLQALELIGVECEDIDYSAKKIDESYNIIPLFKRVTLKSIILYFIQDIFEVRTQKKFAEFRRNYLNISKENYDNNLVHAAGKYDVLIAGGDQVWNRELTGNDDAYFLSFDIAAQKYSYSASIGKDELEQCEVEQLKRYLCDFKGITVREQSAAELLSKECGLVCSVVPDPVFLLKKDEWISKLNLHTSNNKFILFFMLHNNPKMISFANNLSKSTGLPVVRITNDFVKIRGIRASRGNGPIDFVNKIYNAQYIITDSFHALAMSLIFNKEVFIGLKTGNLSRLNIRIENIVDTFLLSERIISDRTENKDMDYCYINKKLDELHQAGNDILKDMVK